LLNAYSVFIGKFLSSFADFAALAPAPVSLSFLHIEAARGTNVLEFASVFRTADGAAARARSGELAAQLRAAAMESDDGRLSRLLSELLRVQGLPKPQRVQLQHKALLQLLRSLSSLALNDDLTGLYNRRGFMQAGTRLLDVAARDTRAAWLVYFDVDHLRRVNESAGRVAGDLLIRQTGNFMRDLFPSYGVYEVLGRLGGDEFAALTTGSEYASRSAILLRARRPQTRASEIPALSLSIGVAPFDPQHPVAIDVLLERGRQAMLEERHTTPMPSNESTPHAV
jgi:diguanylate cyclase (GGDEF)-like protein